MNIEIGKQYTVIFDTKPEVVYDQSPQGSINPRIVGSVRFLDKKLSPVDVNAFIPVGNEDEFIRLYAGKQAAIDHFVCDPDRLGVNKSPFLIMDLRPLEDVKKRPNVREETLQETGDAPVIYFTPESKDAEMAEMAKAFAEYVAGETSSLGTVDKQPKSFSEMTVGEKSALAEVDPFNLAGIVTVRPQYSSSIPKDLNYDDKFVAKTGIKKSLEELRNDKNNKDLVLKIQMQKAQYYHGAFILFLLNIGDSKLRTSGHQLLRKYQSSVQKGFEETELKFRATEAVYKEAGKSSLIKFFDERLRQAIARSRNNGDV